MITYARVRHINSNPLPKGTKNEKNVSSFGFQFYEFGSHLDIINIENVLRGNFYL